MRRHYHCHPCGPSTNYGAWLVGLVLFVWALPILVGILVAAVVIVVLWKLGNILGAALGRYIVRRLGRP